MSQILESPNHDGSVGSSLKSKLKCLFRSQKEIPKLIEIEEEKLSQTWEKHYVNMTLLDRQEAKNKQPNEIEGAKQIELQNVFESGNSSAIGKVLLLGVGGAGKSTLLNYITYRWGNEDLWSDRFDIVVRIRLKYLLNSNWKGDYDLEKLRENKLAFFIHHNLKLQYLDLEENPKEEYRIKIPIEQKVSIDDILRNKGKILLLVDGYNEVSYLESCKDAVDFREIMGLIYQNKYTIMSSRPNALKTKDLERFDRILEIENLDLEKAMKYINSFHGNDDELNSSLISFLERNNQIRGICEIPINMVLLCLIWTDESIKESFKSNADVNIQLLYHEVILWLGKKYLVAFHDWEPEHIVSSTVFDQEIIRYLQKIAFDSFIAQGNFVNNKLIQKYLGTLNIANIYKFGILKPVGFQTDIVKRDFQFIHPTFQEYLTALHLNNKLASSDQKETAYSCNLIGQHRNEPKYLMVLKFLAGIVSSLQFVDESEGKVRLVQRTWLALTCNVDGVLEFGLDLKVTLLMHLLEQSKVKGVYDVRIPNLNKIIEFIDSEILLNVTKWQKQIVESGYISKGIHEDLEGVFDDAEHQNELKLRVAIEIFTNLVNKSEFGGRSSVLQKIKKMLTLDNWQLQKLSLEKMKLLVDSRVHEDLLKGHLELVMPLISNKNVKNTVDDLLIKIIFYFPSLIHNIFDYLETVILAEDFSDKNLAKLVIDFVLKTLEKIPKDDVIRFSAFEMLKLLFVNLNYGYNLHSDLLKGLWFVIRSFPKDQLSDHIEQFFGFLKNFILDFKVDVHIKCTADPGLIDLFIFIPEDEKVEMVGKIFIIYKEVLKSSESEFYLKRDVIGNLPKLLSNLPKYQVSENVVQTIEVFDFLLVNPQTNDNLIPVVVDNLPNLIKPLPAVFRLEKVIQLLAFVEELLKHEAWKVHGLKQHYMDCVSKLVCNIFEDDFQPTFEIYEILEKIIKDTNHSEDFREVILNGLFSLVKSAAEKVELIDKVFNLLTAIINQKENNQLVYEILITLPRIIATTPETHLIEKTEKLLDFLEKIQASNCEVLNVRIPALRSILTLSVTLTLLNSKPNNLLTQINHALHLLETIIQNPVNDPESTFEVLHSLLDNNLIPCLVHLSEKQKCEMSNQIFNLLETVMKSPNFDLLLKWTASCSVERLIRHSSKEEAVHKLDITYEILQNQILESTDHSTKIIVLNSLAFVQKEIVDVAANGVLKLFSTVLESPKSNLNMNFEAVGGILKLCGKNSDSPKDRLSLDAAFNTLHAVIKNVKIDVYSRLISIQNLIKVVNTMPKEQVDAIAEEAIRALVDVIMNEKCDTTIGNPAFNAIACVLKAMSANQDILLDTFFNEFRMVLLEYKNINIRFVVLLGLPKVVTAVKGSANKLLDLLHEVLQNENENFLQEEARKSIALLVENYDGEDLSEVAKQAFDILFSRNDVYSKYFGVASVDHLTKITKAMALRQSIDLLRSDVVNIREGARKGILNRLTASTALHQTDYTQIEGLLSILELCSEQKDTIDKHLYTASTANIKQIVDNVKETELKWIIDNFNNLTRFNEVKFVVKCLYQNLISHLDDDKQIVSPNFNVFLVECIKNGFATTIQRIRRNNKGGTNREYEYQIMFEDVSCTIQIAETTDLNNIINTALELNNPLAEQYRKYRPIFINDAPHFGLPKAAFDVQIFSLVNKEYELNSDGWHLSLLHLSDHNKDKPITVFALIERRNHFGCHLIYKVHVENKEICVIFYEQHPDQVTTEFCEEIFGKMPYLIIPLTKPRYYVSWEYPVQLKEGEDLIKRLENSNARNNGIDDYEIIHGEFEKYFDNISWNEYKIGQFVIEIKKDILLKLNAIHTDEARRFSQIIDKLTVGDEMKGQQEELHGKIVALEEELRENKTATQEDKIKIQQMLDKLKSLEKMNSEQRQRIVKMTESIHTLLSEGELSAERIMSLEQQCEQLQATNTQMQPPNAQTPQPNDPHINYVGSGETNDDSEYIDLK